MERTEAGRVKERDRVVNADEKDMLLLLYRTDKRIMWIGLVVIFIGERGEKKDQLGAKMMSKDRQLRILSMTLGLCLFGFMW